MKHVVQNKMTCFHPCYNSTRVKSLMPGMDLSPCKKGLHSSQEETETGFCLFSSGLFISHQGELIEHKEFLIWVTCHSSSSGWGCSISSFVWHSQTHLVQPGQASAELGLTLTALCVTNPSEGWTQIQINTGIPSQSVWWLGWRFRIHPGSPQPRLQ